ncbi:MAG: glycosyltransferase [Bernardetiaceae bacterium]
MPKVISAPSKAAQPVSVVVAARNERDNLSRLLPALQTQIHPDFEIILVDDRSNDGTTAWLQELSKTIPRLRVISITQKPDRWDGKKYALTQGIIAARHDCLLFTDADCLPASPHWLRTMTAPLNSSQVQFVLGYGAYLPRPGWLNALIQFETQLTAFHYLASAALGHPYMGVGRNLAYRKSFFLEKGGFAPWHQSTGGDDDLWVGSQSTAQNTAIVLSLEAHTYSTPHTHWRHWLRQKHRHLGAGKGYAMRHKIWVVLWQGSYLGTLLLIPLTFGLSPESQKNLLLALIGFRYVYWGCLWYGLQKRLNKAITPFFVFIFEVIYLLYYIGVGFWTLTGKRTSWT